VPIDSAHVFSVYTIHHTSSHKLLPHSPLKRNQLYFPASCDSIINAWLTKQSIFKNEIVTSC